MARGRAAVVPMLALLFGAAAVSLSMLAYATRIKSHEVERTPKGCSYPRSPSFALGILAALALLIEQLIISVGIRCFCCGGTKCPTNWYCIISVIVYVLSWLSFMITFIGLIATAIDNNQHHLAKKCKTGRDDLFQGAAIWCVFTVVLSLISYAFFKAGVHRNRSNQRGDSLANKGGNVAIGETTMQEK